MQEFLRKCEKISHWQGADTLFPAHQYPSPYNASLSNRFDYNSFDVCVSADAIKRKEPIVRVPDGYGLSALRLCVWLFDNGYIELFYMDQGFLPTFRTE